MPEDNGKNGVERLAENPWLKSMERIAIPLIVGALIWIGATLNGLQVAVVELKTTQQTAIAPGVQNLVDQYNAMNNKMLAHKWFGRDDAERMDDQHRKIMDGLSHRVRGLETTGE